MKYIYALLLLKIYIFASITNSPHNLDINGVDINSEQCIYCHISSYGKNPNYTATLCLGCHDGVHAKNILQKNDFIINQMSSHPFSIEYIEGISGLRQKNTQINNWDNASTINDILINEKVECASCHYVHNKTNVSYLRRTNINNELCKTCHKK